MRTRRAPGRIVKCSGGSNMSASPSTPAGTGLFDSTAKVDAVHCRHVGRCPLPAGADEHCDTEQAVVDARPCSRADQRAQPVGVVRDHDDDRLPVGDLARALVSQVVVARRRRPRRTRASCRAWSAALRRGSRRSGRPAAYRPSDTLFTNTRPFTSARSTRRSPPLTNASSAPTTSLRSTPRSRAK